MKKLTLFSLFSCLWFTVSAQTTPPTVPSQVDFAGISVRFDDGARRVIQQDVNALYTNRQYWNAKLDRVALYFPIMEAILIDEEVPTDFKYLAVQESSLTPDAVSSSFAVGYWQFKPETAQDQGMRVDDVIDERKSITASTHGAAQYMKKSNTQFNNWVSSLYSFYLGAGGISKLIPPDWAYAKEITLDSRTDRYVLRFFAHKIAIEDALKSYRSPTQTALIEYAKGNGKTMSQVTSDLKTAGVTVTEDELRKYNRWVLADSIPSDKDYVLVIPVTSNQINDTRAKITAVTTTKKTPQPVQTDIGFPVLQRITSGVSSPSEPILYEINGLPGIQAQAGDNATSLSRKAKISYSSFLRYNDMTDRDPVITNEVYYLAKKRKKALVPYHTVREDETSRSISQRYGIRLKKLLRYNRLDRVQKLQTGRVVWLRERRPSNRPIEIINAPTPNVIDRTPAKPVVAQSNSSRADMDNGSAMSSGSVASSGAIPRNASERKMYQPKLVPSQTVSTDQPETGAAKLDPVRQAAQPVRRASGDWSTPSSASRNAAPVPTPAAGESAVMSTPLSPTPVTDGNATQRVIIVRSDENPAGTTLSETSGSRMGSTDMSVASRSATTSPKRPATRPAAVPMPPAESADAEPAPAVKPLKNGGYEELPSTTVSSAPKVTSRPARQPDADLSEVPRVTSRPARRPDADLSEAPRVTSRPTPPAEKPVSSPEHRPVAPTRGTDNRTLTHTVEPGQTYYSISKLYGISVDDLLAGNNLTSDDKLSVGKRLVIRNVPTGFPVGQVVTPSASAVKSSYSSGSDTKTTTVHTVVKGETMFRISRQYGVNIEQIKEWNHLTDGTVKEGQKLKIQQP